MFVQVELQLFPLTPTQARPTCLAGLEQQHSETLKVACMSPCHRSVFAEHHGPRQRMVASDAIKFNVTSLRSQVPPNLEHLIPYLVQLLPFLQASLLRSKRTGCQKVPDIYFAIISLTWREAARFIRGNL